MSRRVWCDGADARLGQPGGGCLSQPRTVGMLTNHCELPVSIRSVRVDGNKKGLFTRDRRPKSAAFTVRRRWLDASRADGEVSS